MTSRREITKRRKSVQNIRKITKTMEMIAAARMSRALARALAARPFAEQLRNIVTVLAQSGQTAEQPLLRRNDESRRVILLVLTSNRGLCGGYNSAVLRLAHHQADALLAEGLDLELRASGRKGIHAFSFTGRPPQARYTQFDDKVSFAQVAALADEFIDLYQRRAIRLVRIVHTRYISSAQHGPQTLDLLPLEPPPSDGPTHGPSLAAGQYLFSPHPDQLLTELLPATVRSSLFHCFLDAALTEQIARRAAMKAATENADQMIDTLTRLGNRARQSQITSELLDIMGGAEALT